MKQSLLKRQSGKWCNTPNALLDLEASCHLDSGGRRNYCAAQTRELGAQVRVNVEERKGGKMGDRRNKARKAMRKKESNWRWHEQEGTV